MPMTCPPLVEGSDSSIGLAELGHSALRSKVSVADSVDFSSSVTELAQCAEISGQAHVVCCRARAPVQPTSSPAADGGTRSLGAWYSAAYRASPPRRPRLNRSHPQDGESAMTPRAPSWRGAPDRDCAHAASAPPPAR